MSHHDLSQEEWSAVFSALTERQLDAVCTIAFGGDDRAPGHAPRTMRALVGRGIVHEATTVEYASNFAWHWKRWVMPLSVHVAFCSWCSEVAEVEP